MENYSMGSDYEMESLSVTISFNTGGGGGQGGGAGGMGNMAGNLRDIANIGGILDNLSSIRDIGDIGNIGGGGNGGSSDGGGANGWGVSFMAQTAEQNSNTEGHTWKYMNMNAANGKINIKTNKRGASFKGITGKAKDIVLDIAGHLHLETLFDEETYRMDGSSAHVGGSIGSGGSSISAGGGYQSGVGDKKWTDTQTGFIGTNSVRVNAESMHLAGAILAHDGGDDLIVDVKTITYEDPVNMYDTLSITGETYGATLSSDSEGGKGVGVNFGDVDKGHDKQSILRSTIGAGQIITNSDYSGLNRDQTKAIEVIKDESWNESDDISLHSDMLNFRENYIDPMKDTFKWSKRCFYWNKNKRTIFWSVLSW